MSDLWTDIELDSESSDDRPSDELIKKQENTDDQEQDEVVSVPQRNPRRLIRGDQRALRLIKGDIEKSKDTIFFIKHRSTESVQSKWYLVQVDMELSYIVEMREYEVYRCRWHIRHHEDGNKNPALECNFCSEIR